MKPDRSLHTELLPAREGDSRRLLVVLHGLGDSLEGYRWMPTELRLPWLNYLLVNAPDDYFGGYSWYDIYGEAGPGVTRSRALLTALLEDLPRCGFEPANTALFGFSQGCLMALETGLRYPHRLAGLIGISGYLHNVATLLEELSPVAGQQRMLMTHGTQDPLLPIAPVRQQAELLRARGLNLEWHEFAKAHTIAGEDELRLIRNFLNTCPWGQSLKPE
jgi:phospholipase/carboxylesterase